MTNINEKIPDVAAHCERWFAEYMDILGGVLLELPPLWEINHRIPLIDVSKRYYYHLPQCPEAMKPQLMEKL
jgi:hypothetical protein